MDKNIKQEMTYQTEEERIQKELQDAEDKKNRGNYRCSRCNLPKKGHVCPYQQRFKRRDQPVEGTTVPTSSRESECQVEFDQEFTVRYLGELDKQGLPESYEPIVLPTLALLNGLNDSFRNIGGVENQQIH